MILRVQAISRGYAILALLESMEMQLEGLNILEVISM